MTVVRVRSVRSFGDSYANGIDANVELTVAVSVGVLIRSGEKVAYSAPQTLSAERRKSG